MDTNILLREAGLTEKPINMIMDLGNILNLLKK